jgi:hypothetical protein
LPGGSTPCSPDPLNPFSKKKGAKTAFDYYYDTGVTVPVIGRQL